MPSLFLELKNEVKTFELPEGMHVFIGRDPVCEISLASPKVSRIHAVIIFKNGICGVKDLGSHNGTWLNDQRLAAPVLLRDNDRLNVGAHSFLFRNNTGNGVGNGAGNGAKAPASSDTRPVPPVRPLPETTEAAATMRRLMDEVDTLPDKPAITLKGSDTQDLGEPSTRRSTASTSVRIRERVSERRRQFAEDKAKANATATDLPDLSHLVEDSFPTVDMPRVQEIADTVANTAVREVVPGMDTAAIEAVIINPEDNGPEENEPEENGAAKSESDSEPATDTGLHDPEELAHDLTMETIPVSDDLRKAVDERLKLYRRLGELAVERKKFRAKNKGLPKNARDELERQDRELNSVPTLEQAEALRTARRSSWQDHFDADGKPSDSAVKADADLSIEMLSSEKMALDQWELIIESGRKHLPEIYRLAYRVMAAEPLARELDEARVDHSTLLGGAAYCLTLEALQKETEDELESVRERIEKIREGTEEEKPGAPLVGRVVFKVSRLLNLHKVDKKKLDAFLARERSLTARSKSLRREELMIEKTMVREFWKVYADAACHYFPSGRELPPAVRAFFRFGSIGTKPWWISDSGREYIESHCQDDVATLETGNAAVNILYADEYLPAVMRMECSPGPRGQGGNSGIDEKTDRVLRRLVNSRNRTALFREILDEMRGGLDSIESELGRIGAESLEMASGGRDTIGRREALKSEQDELTAARRELTERYKRVKRSADECVEIYADAEKLFGESRVSMPSASTVVRRECETLAEIAAHLAGARQRFLPLLIRDGTDLLSGHMDEHESTRQRLREIEELDPGLFLVNVIPAKKRSNRIDLRCAPVTVIVPSHGVRGYACQSREGLENGRLALPTSFSRANVQRQRMVDMLAEYRWDTSLMVSGRDVMNSETLAGAFSRLRWSWREQSKEKRERGLIFSDLNDKANWRRVYDAWLQDREQGGKRLASLNPECYSGVIAKYVELPDEEA